MAISYKEIKKLVRFRLKDNDEITFSDYEIQLAYNRILRWLSTDMASDKNNDALETGIEYDERAMNSDPAKEETYDFKRGGIELPEDFMNLVAVKGHRHELLQPCPSIQDPMPWEYKIMGGRIYCGQPHFRLLYRRSLGKMTADDDEVELPDQYIDVLVNLTCMILQNSSDDVMQDAVYEAIKKMSSKGRYRNARIKPPFRIGW